MTAMVLSLMVAGRGVAQVETTMTNGDTIVVSACQFSSGTIYDDGGALGDYSNRFDGCVTLEARAGATITLSGNYETESANYDWIRVWDGDELVVDRCGGSGSLNVTSVRGSLTIEFHSDGLVTGSGFVFAWTSENAGECTATVNGLMATEVTDSTIAIAWDGRDSSGPYLVFVDDERYTTADTHYVAGGLSADRRYRIIVIDAAEEGNFCCADNIWVRTECGLVQSPYSEGFEDYAVDSFPNCWLRQVNFDDAEYLPRVDGNHSQRGTRSLMVSCGGNNTGDHFGLVSTTPFAGSGLRTTHLWMMASHSNTYVVVGVCDNEGSEYDSYGFRPVDTLMLSTTWADYRVDWTATEVGQRLAVRMVQGMQSGIGRRVYIDEMGVETCGVDSLTAVHVDYDRLTLTWSTFNDPQCTVKVRREGADTDTLTIENAVSPLHIDGLQASATYTFSIWPTCGESTSVGRNISVTMPSMPRNADGYCSGLREGGMMPEGWTTYRDNNASFGYSSSRDGVYWYGNNNSHNSPSYLISDRMMNLAGKRVLVQYSSSTNGRIQMGIMEYADDITTFTELNTVNINSSTECNRTAYFDIPDTIDNGYIALGLTGSYYGYIYITALEIGDTAQLMGDQRRIHRHGSTIEIEWDRVRDTVLVEYGARGMTPGSGTVDTFYNTQRGTVAGLEHSTYYDFYIYQPDWHPCRDRVLEEHTAAVDYGQPYCEDFSQMTESNGWSTDAEDWTIRYSVNGTPRFTNHPYNYTDLGRTLEMASWGMGGYNSEVSLPDIETDSVQWMSFYITDDAPQSEIAVSGVSTIACDNSRSNIGTITVNASAGRQHCVMRLDESQIRNRQLTLQYRHSYPYIFYRSHIDELQVAPSAYGKITPTHISYDSATFNIDTVYGADSVEVTLLSAADTHTVTIGVADIDTIGFGGLASNRKYKVYVRPTGGGCASFATSIITRSDPTSDGDVSGEGFQYADCYTMSDVLSYELPTHWASEGDHAVTTSDELRIEAHTALATHPSRGLNGRTLSLRARSTAMGDTLKIGIYPADSISTDSVHFTLVDSLFVVTDTFLTDTTWNSFAIKTHDIPAGKWRLCFLVGNGDVFLDDIGISSCPMVYFESDGNVIVCHTDYPFNYYLSIEDSAGNESRIVRVDESPFRVVGAKLDTKYTLSWRCDENQSCIPQTTLRTGKGIPLPYCEHFDQSYSNLAIPSTWTVAKGNSGDTLQPSTYPALHMYPAGAKHWFYTILPMFNTDSALSIHVQAEFSGYYVLESDQLQIGVLADGTDTSSFIPLYGNQYSTSNYSSISIDASADLCAYTDKRVAIRCQSAVYLRNIRVYGIPLPTYSLPHAGTLRVSSPVAKPYLIEDANSGNFVRVSNREQDIPLGTGNHSIRQTDTLGLSCENFTTLKLFNTASLPYCPNSTQYINRDSWYVMDELLTPSLNGVTARITHSGTAGDTLLVGMLTDALDMTTFVPLDTLTGTGIDIVDLSAYTDTGRWIGFRNIPTSSNSYIYISQTIIDNCPGAMSATASLTHWNQVKIDATAVPFYVEYYNTYTSSLGNTANPIVRIDSVPYILTLAPNTQYRFNFRCDSLTLGCLPSVDIKTLSAPLPIQTCIDFDTLTSGTVPLSWTPRSSDIGITSTQSHSPSNSLAIPIGTNAYIITPDIVIDSLKRLTMSMHYYTEDPSDRLTVGVFNDPYNMNTYHPIRTLAPGQAGAWQRGLVDFSSAPDGANYIVFQASSNHPANGRTVYIDDIYLDTSIAYALRVKDINSTSITLDWNHVGDPQVTLTVKDGDSIIRVFDNPTPPLLIDSITMLHYYTFLLANNPSNDTGFCNTNNTDSLSVITPAPSVGCINATDLNSSQAVFFNGTYNNPYSTSGAVDYGASHPDSRHTICYDTAARDPRTGNLLRTIPQGYTSSVRLGNWSTNTFTPEAEGVIYSLYVDTTNFELLLLRYAAVLQNPMHASSDQPRFRMELLDTNFNIIDSSCTSADFIADRNLGWNTADDGVLWKDWTAVGIDLSAHAGEQVYLRLTTYDCNEGSHYGYAYFTLECMRKNMNTESCGDVETNTLRAPEGFNYRWYTSESPATISTSQSITIPSEDITYFCDVSKVDNDGCFFTISVYGGTRYPMANFDTSYHIDNCHFVVQFNNLSAISNDGATPLSNTSCETAYWDFGNGQTSSHYHGSTTYMLPGTYTVMLVSGIANNACRDTAYQTLVLELPEGIMPSDTVIASICDNHSYPFYDSLYSIEGTYYHATPNPGICDSMHVLQLQTRATNGSDTIAIVCDSLRWRNILFTADSIHTTPPVGLNALGCDSTVTLDLTVYYSDTAEVHDTIVQNTLPYSAAGTAINLTDLTASGPHLATGQWQLHTSTVHSCDSTLHLHLNVWLNRDTIIDTSICRNRLPLTYNGNAYSPSEPYSSHIDTIPTSMGADSVITLNITVYDNPTAAYADTVVENDLPHIFRGISFNMPIDTSLVLLGSGIACDTLTTYSMHVWFNHDTTLYRSICHSELPYTWEGYSFSTADSSIEIGINKLIHHDVIVPTTHGADSTLHLELTVRPSYDTVDTIIVCPWFPYTYRDVDYGGPSIFDTTLRTTQDCDSNIHVVLRPRDTTFHINALYSLGINSPWEPIDSCIIGCAPDTLYLIDSTANSINRQWLLFSADTLAETNSMSLNMALLRGNDSLHAIAVLRVESEGSCWDTAAWPIIVLPSPVAEFDWSPTNPPMHNPEATFINLTYEPDTLRYLWNIQRSVGGAYDTTTVHDPFYHWNVDNLSNAPGDYRVVLSAYLDHQLDTLLHGDWYDDSSATLFHYLLPTLHFPLLHTCIDSTDNVITITNDYLQFPNLVTPNGDGNNDIWKVVNLIEFGNYSMNELWIYDRWGVLVYHVQNITTEQQFWDPNSTNSPDGTYYYRFSARSMQGSVKRNGLIEVLRD